MRYELDPFLATRFWVQTPTSATPCASRVTVTVDARCLPLDAPTLVPGGM